MEPVLQAGAVAQVQTAAVRRTQPVAEAAAMLRARTTVQMQTAAVLTTQSVAEAQAPVELQRQAAAPPQPQVAAELQVHAQAAEALAQVKLAAVEQARAAAELQAEPAGPLHRSPRVREPVPPHLPRAGAEKNSAGTCASISIEIPSIAARAHASVLQRKARWRHAAPDAARRSASLVGRLVEMRASMFSAILSTATAAG